MTISAIFPTCSPRSLSSPAPSAPEDIDGISFLPELIGADTAGHPQAEHDYLYWEIGDWIAIRKQNWRAVKPAKSDSWELYDLDNDPSESNDLSKQHPDKLSELIALAKEAHEPVREGTFETTVRHERDRRAKFGRQDESEQPQRRRSRPTAHTMPTEDMLSNKDWKVIRASSENSGNKKFATMPSMATQQPIGTHASAEPPRRHRMSW